MTTDSNKNLSHNNLSRRERQIVDVLYAEQEATAAQVQKALPGEPSYSTVRALLKKLLDKGHVQFRQDGPRYVYSAIVAKSDAGRGAIRRLLHIFFNGNPVAAVANLLGDQRRSLSDDDIDELERLVATLKAERNAGSATPDGLEPILLDERPLDERPADKSYLDQSRSDQGARCDD